MAITSTGRWELLYRGCCVSKLSSLRVSRNNVQGPRTAHLASSILLPARLWGCSFWFIQTNSPLTSHSQQWPLQTTQWHSTAVSFLPHTWVFHVQEFLPTVETSPRGLHFCCWNCKRNSNLKTFFFFISQNKQCTKLLQCVTHPGSASSLPEHLPLQTKSWESG